MAYRTKRNKYYSKHFTKRRKYSGGNGLTVKNIFELGRIIQKIYKKNNKEMDKTLQELQPISEQISQNQTIVSVKMFYNTYKIRDGYYLDFSQENPLWTQITLEFIDEGNAWRQYSGNVEITDFYRTTGIELLTELNRKGRKRNPIITSYSGKQVYPKLTTVSVPNSTVPNSTVSVEMFHDAYETMYGDGFYPGFTKHPEWTQITVEFIDEGNAWKQYGEISINGLDDSSGRELLAKLNKEGGKNNLIIKSSMGEQLYPKKGW